jgi:hypothetical protein
MRRSRPEPTASRRGVRSRWLRIGPGLILAIVASVYIWVQNRPDLAARPDRPVVDRVPPVVARPPATPEIADLLKQADALALTPHQRAAIARLVEEWAPESAERRREMDQAATAFNDYMRGARQRRKENTNEIYRNAAETSALTSDWLARKASFWQRGLAELRPEQRRQAMGLLSQRKERFEQPRRENEP